MSPIDVIADGLPSWLPFRRAIARALYLRLHAENYRVVKYDSFAVIYDVEDPEIAPELREEFYEVFSSPAEATVMYRDAFGDDNYNPRLVLILGPIEDFESPRIYTNPLI